jgi:hypothetical protein
MANTKLTALTAASTPDFTEYLYAAQGGNSRKLQLSQFGQKDNLTAVTNPGASDDSTAFYSAGSMWFNTVTAQYWICRSASAAAALWTLVGIADQPGYVSGRFYYPGPGWHSGAGSALSTNNLRLVPFALKQRVTIQGLGTRITTAAASGLLQLGVYGFNAATGRPTGACLAQSQSMSTTGSTTSAALLGGTNVTLEPGFYFSGVNVDATGSGAAAMTVASNSVWCTSMLGSATIGNVAASSSITTIHLSVSGTTTFGTWPDLTAATFTEATTQQSVMLMFQVA